MNEKTIMQESFYNVVLIEKGSLKLSFKWTKYMKMTKRKSEI